LWDVFPVRTGLALILALGLASSAFAEDDAARRAREELESQLHDMVRIPPPQLEVVFDGIDAPDYVLVSGTFALDGQTLPFTEAELHTGKVLFTGTLAAGPHTFTSQLLYQEDPRTVFTYMSGTKFKVPGRVEFSAQRGLRLHLRAGVHVDAAADLQHRLKPAAHVTPEMLAQVDDGSMPDAPPRKRMVEVVDAGPPLAVAQAEPTPAAAPESAAEPDDASKPEKRAHTGNRASRKGGATTEHPILAALKPSNAVRKVETQAPQALTDTPPAPPPTLVAMASPPAVPAPAPAAVVIPASEEGLSLGAKLGLVAGFALLALVGITVFVRTRR
jgi:hypothetical protein